MNKVQEALYRDRFISHVITDDSFEPTEYRQLCLEAQQLFDSMNTQERTEYLRLYQA